MPVHCFCRACAYQCACRVSAYGKVTPLLQGTFAYQRTFDISITVSILHSSSKTNFATNSKLPPQQQDAVFRKCARKCPKNRPRKCPKKCPKKCPSKWPTKCAKASQKSVPKSVPKNFGPERQFNLFFLHKNFGPPFGSTIWVPFGSTIWVPFGSTIWVHHFGPPFWSTFRSTFRSIIWWGNLTVHMWINLTGALSIVLQKNWKCLNTFSSMDLSLLSISSLFLSPISPSYHPSSPPCPHPSCVLK